LITQSRRLEKFWKNIKIFNKRQIVVFASEEWDGTHSARLIEDFCEVRNKKSNEWTAQVLSEAKAERRGNPGVLVSDI
jgi:hypothetical protein